MVDRPSLRLPRPFRALTHTSTAVSSALRTGSHRPFALRATTALLSVVCSSAHEEEYARASEEARGSCHPPAEARSQRFYALSEPVFRPRLLPSQACFIPGTLLSFRLQGFDPCGDPLTFPPTFLPCCFASHSDDPHSFEGLRPPQVEVVRYRSTARPQPSWRSPL